jgi:hypothetical protein
MKALDDCAGTCGTQPARGHEGPRRGVAGCPVRPVEESEDLTANQAAKLAWIAKANARLYRAYLIKEQLSAVFD